VSEKIHAMHCFVLSEDDNELSSDDEDLVRDARSPDVVQMPVGS